MIATAVRLAQATSSTTTVVLLVAFNLLPLVGVLFWGWNVSTLLVLYWVENGIIGILNVPKMFLAQGPESERDGFVRINGRVATSKVPQVGFFLVHYGIFWVVHGVFVFTLPFFVGMGADVGGIIDGPGPGFDPIPGSTFEPIPGIDSTSEAGVRARGPDLSAVGWGALGLAASHGASFVINFLGRREYLKISPAAQMFAPYGRLMILHLTIIFGAIVSLSLGSPIGAIVVLVILKTVVDLVFHIREHGWQAVGQLNSR